MIQSMHKNAGFTVPLLKVGLWALPWGAYSILTYFKQYQPFSNIPDIPIAIDAALSFAMALVIAFRVNRAYERWWEARTLWGTLVNVSRNLAIKVKELPDLNSEDRVQMEKLIIAFCTGLKGHLRNEPKLQGLPGFEHETNEPKHLPSHIVGNIYRMFAKWKSEGKLNDQQIWVLDSEARVLLDVCGGCERIKNTLMSISWRSFSVQCIVIYLLVLPWEMVDDFKYWTVPLTMTIAYFAFAGEGIARYVEEPFGLEEDHLDLEGMVAGIDESVSEILND
jgi:putative membrane protein